MTIEEYKNLAGTATPENFQTVLTSVLKEVQTDIGQIDALKTQAEEQATKIRDLQDTNQKLFLSQTSSVNSETENEDPAEGLIGFEALDVMSDQIKDKAGDKTGISILF